MEAVIHLPSMVGTVTDSCPQCLRPAAANLALRGVIPAQTPSSQAAELTSGRIEIESHDLVTDHSDELASLSSKQLLALATNPGTAPDVLACLAKFADPALLERVAENPHTDRHTLAALAGHCSREVRQAVAENWNAPYATLWMLASDECADVRFRLAENHNVPSLLLEYLVADQNPYVRFRAQTTLKRLKAGQATRLAYAG